MGLLNSDQWSALGLLGSGIMQKNPGAGFGAAMQYLDGADERKLKMQLQQGQLGLLGAQLKETEAQAAERTAKVADMQRKQSMIERMFPNGIGAPEVSPGAFAPSPSQAGPMGPTMPQSMANMAAPGSRLARMGFDDLAALKVGAGIDLTDLHKYANDPLKMESGSTYRDRVTGQERYMPKLPEGMAPGQDGFYGFLPGFQQATSGLAGATTQAQEEAKAKYDLVKVVGSDGAERYVPRSQIVGSQQPQGQPQPQMRPQGAAPMPMRGASVPADGDRFAILTQERARALASGNAGDVAAIDRELARLPAGSSSQQGPAGLAVAGGFQATPTTEQATAAAAAKERAIRQAGADVRPVEQRQNEIAGGNYMLSVIDQAIKHPGRETATGVSGTLDPRNYLPGTNAKGFQSVLDQIRGGTFMQAYQNLKGGGQITEVEGKKAENAIARLNTAQSDDDFLGSLNELRQVVASGLTRQKNAAREGGATGSFAGDNSQMVKQPPVPMRGMVRGGYRFKGGDPSSPSSWEKM